MGDSYTQLYIQLVFAVKNRQSFSQKEWETSLYKYITAVLQNNKHKMISINGMPDHLHIFFGLNPTIAIVDVVKDIKKATNNWINSNKLAPENFAWQSGYAAFTYSRSHIQRICAYIENQKHHHAKISFQNEYIALLKAFDISFKKEYLFEF